MGKEKSKKLFVVGNNKFPGAVIRKESVIFDYDSMLKVMKEWFEDHKYTLNEKAYGGKDLPSREREEKIEWTAERKITDYIKFHISFQLWVRRMGNIKAEGHKLKKGDIYIGFKGWMEKDYKGKWRSEFLRQMYDRFLVPGKLNMYEGKIWAETNDFIALTKKYLGMMPLKKE